MDDVVRLLTQAYSDEVETVANYLALSVSLEGLKAEDLKESLDADVNEELGHARSIAQRLKELGHAPPGSMGLKFQQSYLQPPKDGTDLKGVMQGLMKAEESAISVYRTLIEAAREANDPVTEDLATKILADEEHHRATVRDFLKAE